MNAFVLDVGIVGKQLYHSLTTDRKSYNIVLQCRNLTLLWEGCKEVENLNGKSMGVKVKKTTRGGTCLAESSTKVGGGPLRMTASLV